MTRSKPIIRPTTRQDIVRFYGKAPTMRALTVELDGEPVCIGGIAYERALMKGFMDIKDPIRPFRKTIMKASKQAFEQIIRPRSPVWVAISEEEHAAPAFLKRLGFTIVDEEAAVWLG